MSNYLPCVLVCGGRDYIDRQKLYNYMDSLLFWYGGAIMLMHGAARGADLLSEEWAKLREQIYVGVPAQWGAKGKRAGFTRNAEMASNAITNVDAVVVFYGGKGTINMHSLALTTMDPQPRIWLPDGEFWK